MNLQQCLDYLNSGRTVKGGSEVHKYIHKLSQEAIRICMEINNTHHSTNEIRVLMSELIGKPIDETFVLFPPFTTDCGKNITFGKRVFINSGCRFQDQGGIVIGDDVLIGHNVVLATLNHTIEPKNRKDMIPKPIIIERNVWIGANATVLSGVTIGENSVVAAGAVVTKNVAKNTIVGGVPARIIKTIEENEENKNTVRERQ
ncbi:MAG: sugar O-acetyltransferase [Clostridiales bacterium]|nr:sugar O-acetyltransferase [Clostridiales bacterium]